MAKRNADRGIPPPSVETSLQRIANLVALSATRNAADDAEGVRILSAAGFSVTEIASLLGKTANNVSVLLYQARRKPRTRRRSREQG